MSTIAERVAAGAAFLDKYEPGWDQRIDLGKFAIENPCGCVLGQLHGRYALGAEALREFDPSLWTVGLGFFWEADDEEAGAEIDALTAEWKRVITERRAGAS